jgi:hypothetical protein
MRRSDRNRFAAGRWYRQAATSNNVRGLLIMWISWISSVLRRILSGLSLMGSFGYGYDIFSIWLRLPIHVLVINYTKRFLEPNRSSQMNIF